MHRRPAKRPPGPRVHGHVVGGGAPDGREHGEGVCGRAGEGGVAVDGAGAEEAEGRVVGGEEDGECVLGKGGRDMSECWWGLFWDRGEGGVPVAVARGKGRVDGWAHIVSWVGWLVRGVCVGGRLKEKPC